MAYKLTWLLAFFLINHSAEAGEILLTGTYQGKNLFVRNPYIPEEKTFCITEIYVNDILLTNLPRTSALQLDLSHLPRNAPVRIKIVHLDACIPVIVNPEVIEQARDFEFLFVQVDDNSINWITTGETPEGNFELEKLKYDGWEKMMEIESKGDKDNNQYSIEASHYTGDNEYRLTYMSGEGVTFQSEEVSFYSLLEPIKMYPGDKVYDWISLSRDTDWEIYNDYDTLILEGFGSEINVASFEYGDYYIVIEDEPLRFSKPKPEIIPRKKKKKGQRR